MKISRFFSGSKVVWSYSAGHFPFHILCLNLLLNSTPPEKIRNPLVFRYFRNGFKKSGMKYHSLKSCYYFSECQCFIFLCLMEHLWFTARDHRQISLQIWSQFKQVNFYIRKIIRFSDDFTNVEVSLLKLTSYSERNLATIPQKTSKTHPR